MVIEELLVRGASVNAKDRELRSPLHWAMPQPNEIFEDDSIRVPVVRLLLKHETDIDARDSLGQALIHMASRYGRGDIVAVLLEHGLDVNARDFEMRTALHRASKVLFSRASAHRLLEAVADMHAADQTGQTPLQIAEAPGNQTLREIFYSYRQSSPLES
jgi:ankyrin repeat protein